MLNTVEPSEKTNIVLIGMPGCGKSTFGRTLSKRLGKQFIDTDALIEQDQNMPIQAVVTRKGLKFMRQLEERILMDLSLSNHIIATGGSAVYSARAMQYLGHSGIRVYLKISLASMVKRVGNTRSRGLVKAPSYPLPRLYTERLPLYAAAADVEFSNDWPISGLIVDALIKRITEYKSA